MKNILCIVLMLSVMGCHTNKVAPSLMVNSNASVSSESTGVGDLGFRKIGRFVSAEGKESFSWAGSAVEFVFSGVKASAVIESDERIRFHVDVDGERRDLWVKAGRHSYVLAAKLMLGNHHVRLTRATESFNVTTSIIGMPIVEGKLLAVPSNSTKKILFLGDSITAGYGVEGANKDCGYSLETSSVLLSYAGLTAEALQADAHYIAWSGIGVSRSYGEVKTINPTMSTRHHLTLAHDLTAKWDVEQFQPDVIVVNLGTNDFWDGSGVDYSRAMADFLTDLENTYPKKTIYLVVSAMLKGEVRDIQEQVLHTLAKSKAAMHVVDLGAIKVKDGLGCDHHPNMKTQKRMAEVLVGRLKREFNW